MSRFQIYIAASQAGSPVRDVYGMGLGKLAQAGPAAAVQAAANAATGAVPSGGKLDDLLNYVKTKGKAVSKANKEHVQPALQTAKDIAKATEGARDMARGAVNLTTPDAQAMMAARAGPQGGLGQQFLGALTGRDATVANQVQGELGQMAGGWRRFLPGANAGLAQQQQIAQQAAQAARLKQVAAWSPIVAGGAAAGAVGLNAANPGPQQQPYPVSQIYGR